jgi:hypothetical protein
MGRKKRREKPRRETGRKELGDTNSWFGYLTMVMMMMMDMMSVTVM